MELAKPDREEQRILWKSLKKICEDICKIPVNIMLTTELDQNLNSATVFNEKEATIFLNAMYCKGENMVFKGIAHEIAHILEGDAIHGNSWENRKRVVYERIEDEYGVVVSKIRRG
jgi:hypothetical protein